ncbi:MAG: DUF3052 domain-containing protein [Bacteroidota bacterium]
MSTAGYSGTPLARKLGIKEGSSIQVFNAPKRYQDFFEEFPSNVQWIKEGQSNPEIDFIHIFCTHWEGLERCFALAKANLKKSGMIWLSWPKKTSKIPTQLDKTLIREFGLRNGLVDTKVAAIDNDWSGHKFMYRIKDRD